MIRHLFIYIAFIIYQPGLSLAETLRVCQNCQFNTIKDAIAAAQSGDTILIEKGIYKEGTIRIEKPITLEGIDLPVIDGENNHELIQIVSDNVTIRGLQIQNVGTSYTEDRAGIVSEDVSGLVIENNKLINTFFGIYLQKTENSIVRNNVVAGEAVKEISSGNAIQLWYCKKLKIINNMVKNHRDGIYLEFVDESQIVGNTSEDNLRYGLHFMFSNDDKYIDNTFKNNGSGVAVMFSKRIEMTGNRFIENWGAASYGLLLKEIYDGSIENNYFNENTIGIYGESANRLMIRNNVFERNGWAMKILGSCMDNTFTRNNFIGNTFDLSTNSPRNYNDYDGNYWSEYTGYDLDHDGFGDVPYRPMKLFSYVVTKVDPSIILLRSFFIHLINFAEKVTPVFTPETLVDNKPLMRPAL